MENKINPYLKGIGMRNYLLYSREDIDRFHTKRIEDLLSIFSKIEKNKIYNKKDHIKNIFINKNIKNSNKREYSTSGTTGESFRFRVDPLFCIYRNSYIIQKIISHYGIDINDILFVKISPHRQMQNSLIEGSLGLHNNMISIRETYLEKAKKRFKNKSIVIISSPSIYRKIKDNKIDLECDIKLCISSLESIIDRESLEEYYQSKFVDWITCYDGGISAWECKNGNYHIDFEFCKVSSDDRNRLILTDLWNIRELFYNYHNGDYGIVSGEYCFCGNNGYILDKYLGRETEILEVNGRKIYGMEIYSTLFPDLCFKESILKQDSTGIVFHYFGGNKKDIDKVNERMRFLFGDNYILQEEENLDYFNNYNGKKKKIYSE